jgi:aminobenzoyl-glutamate utilization protein B
MTATKYCPKTFQKPSQQRIRGALSVLAITLSYLMGSASAAQELSPLKQQLSAGIDSRTKLVQEMVDSIFSFAEPGFQEYRTSEYITAILEENGFEIEMGIAGIPTAWKATWGTGKPVIALGSDIDALLGLSQVPGISETTPLVSGAPGHGEGHNSGMPAMVVAALAVKDIMIENNIPGTLMLWPGIAEELLATKAYFVRDGLFDEVDANIFTHVGRDLNTSWGDARNKGMVSVEYSFSGRTSHGAAAPWEGRSALDAVEVMNYAWNMRREHLPLSQRSHYVISNGGGQPNIVPGEASVWYYFRDESFDSVRTLYEIGNTISEAAAMATETTVQRRVLGYAAPHHGNRPIAEAAYENIKMIGLPNWSEDDSAFSNSVQRGLRGNDITPIPLATEVGPLSTPATRGEARMGYSDDVGDIMWTIPTITIGYPSNIPNTIPHHITSAMAMATPIAHKGAVAGAKAVGMTTLDLLTDPSLLDRANDYFVNVQKALTTYDSLLSEDDTPAIELNSEVMNRMRESMEPYYYDPTRYDSYLEQLGINYPGN